MILSQSNLGYDEMKRIVLSSIKGGDFNQYEDIVQKVVNHLLSHNICNETTSYSHSQGYKDISAVDGMLVHQIVWDLIIERVLTIGCDKINNQWPFLRLTDFGKQIIEDDIPIHDVDGIINAIFEKIPEIDNIIIKYLAEALNTYRIGALLSSSVMLGCATEKAIVLLIESYTLWLSGKGEDKEKTKFENSKTKAISRRFEEFNKSFMSHKSSIPSDYYDDFDIVINSVFTIIRKNRNSAGHPTGNKIDKSELALWLHVFSSHCRRIYDLINYFKE